MTEGLFLRLTCVLENKTTCPSVRVCAYAFPAQTLLR